MTLGIYYVEKTLSAYVLAESEDDAENVRLDESGSDEEVTSSEVTDLRSVPSNWRSVLPFSDVPNDKTVAELLSVFDNEIPEDARMRKIGAPAFIVWPEMGKEVNG